MRHSFKTTNTCCKEIQFDIVDGKVYNVEFLGGGCPGNLQAVPKLVEGMTVEEVICRVGGIKCGFRGTSCADQLAQALENAKNEEN